MHVLTHAAVVHAVAQELLYILLVLRMDARAVVRELPVLRTLRPRATPFVYSVSQLLLLAVRRSQVVTCRVVKGYRVGQQAMATFALTES